MYRIGMGAAGMAVREWHTGRPACGYLCSTRIWFDRMLKRGIGQIVDWSREIYMKGIDHSYYYEGYTTYKTQEL